MNSADARSDSCPVASITSSAPRRRSRSPAAVFVGVRPDDDHPRHVPPDAAPGRGVVSGHRLVSQMLPGATATQVVGGRTRYGARSRSSASTASRSAAPGYKRGRTSRSSFGAMWCAVAGHQAQAGARRGACRHGRGRRATRVEQAAGGRGEADARAGMHARPTRQARRSEPSPARDRRRPVVAPP